MADFRNDFANFIRKADAGYELSPHQLATAIVGFLREQGAVSDEATENAIEDFAYEVNRGAGYRQPKPYGSFGLADLIVTKFQLTKEPTR